MKKIISILLIVAMCASVMLSLVSCGGDETAKTDTEKAEEQGGTKKPSDDAYTYADMVKAMLKTYTSDSYTMEMVAKDYGETIDILGYYNADQEFKMYAELNGEYTDEVMAYDDEETYYKYDYEYDYAVSYWDNFFTLNDLVETDYYEFENMILFLLGDEEIDINHFQLNYFLYDDEDSVKAVAKFKKVLNDWAADNIEFSYEIDGDVVEYSMSLDALDFFEEYIRCCQKLFGDEVEDIDYYFGYLGDVKVTLELDVTETDGYMTEYTAKLIYSDDDYSEKYSYKAEFYDINDTEIDIDACEKLAEKVEEYESIDFCSVCYVNEATVVEDDVYYCDECYSEQADEEIIEEMEEIKKDILAEMVTAFEEEGISIVVDKETGDISMDSTVIFGGDSAVLSEEGKAFLKKFIKAYTSIIFSDEYADLVSKTVIEGHIAPIPGSTYESGLPLSKERAANVMNYCLSEEAGLSAEYIDMLKSNIEMVGLSLNKPVYDANGEIDLDASRRVTFRFVIDISKIK